jgi:glycosyltransferase involved in cell wall biosynthesis
MILGLFFTRGVSLKIWVDSGLLDREKYLYEEHLKSGHLSKIFWFTYGSNDKEIAQQLRVNDLLHPSITVIQMPHFFNSYYGHLIYSLAMPIIQRKWLKVIDIFKTNQVDGSWSAVISKLFYQKPLIIRTGYTISLLAQKMGKPIISLQIYCFMERLAFHFADYVTVTSNGDKSYISDRYNVSHPKLVILPNYVDTKLFRPLRNKNKYSDHILFVGRLNEAKNLFNLITAISLTSYSLDIYGSGELRDALELHAEEKNAKVNFKGVVANRKLPEVLSHYNYFILTSYSEGMPKTLMEAMACGLICIGTNVSGINELIRHGENGVLADGTDVDHIRKAIKSIGSIVHSQEALGHSATQMIVNNFSVNKILSQEYRLFLESCMSRFVS